MLNEIFSNYRKQSNEDNNDDLKNEDIDDSKSETDNKQKSNFNYNKSDDFLNEKEIINTKKKSEEIMSKYCTLYNKNNAIKPLNENYLEKKEKEKKIKKQQGQSGSICEHLN